MSPGLMMRSEKFRQLGQVFGPEETLQFRYAVVIADGPADPAQGEELAELGRTALEQWR